MPASAKTEAGFYIAQGPVEIVPIDDERGVVEAAKRIWSLGTPLIPTPDRNSYSRKPHFKLPGVRTWSDIERQCSLWRIEETAEGRFKIERWISTPRERGFVLDASRDEVLPPQTSFDDAIKRLCVRISEDVDD
jgi:hypothetical protein